MTLRFVCVHGHFYQPPRENPWLGWVEPQDSARPYRDWNHRITCECYGPCSAMPARGRDARGGCFTEVYSRISFNFGPTLLSWLERNKRLLYMSLLEADRASAKERGGHGNAIAQVYNHVIMPLASHAEKRVQVRWGLEDFRARFRRPAEGMWLPETAADDATLEALAEAGVRFTVLSPAQAAGVRLIGGKGRFEPVHEASLDFTRPYRWFSKENAGRFVDIFFYSPRLAREIAFENLLLKPEHFAASLQDGFRKDYRGRQLVSVASDGEVFGHHFREGASALAGALSIIGKERGAELTNYAAFLDACPPEYEVDIVQQSSWSCSHGVERWRGDCGCGGGSSRGWNQAWRGPLRASLEWLADGVDRVWARNAPSFFTDPRAALEDYTVCLCRDAAAETRKFLSSHCPGRLHHSDAEKALSLLEMARARQLMFTSCAWFFDELSGLEPVQAMKYAARAAELARSFGEELEAGLLERLEKAPSNISRYRNGAGVYRALVEPARVPQENVAATYALFAVCAKGLPFQPQWKFHFKILAEDGFRRNGTETEAFFFRCEAADSLASREYSALVRRDEKGPACFLKECDHTAHGDLVRSEPDSEAAVMIRGYKRFGPEDAVPGLRWALEFCLPGGDSFEDRRNWLSSLRTALAENSLFSSRSDEVMAAFAALSQAGFKAREIPFADAVWNMSVAHFGFALDTFSASALTRALVMLKSLDGNGYPGGIYELHGLMRDFFADYNPSMAGPEFKSALDSAVEFTGVKTKHHAKQKD